MLDHEFLNPDKLPKTYNYFEKYGSDNDLYIHLVIIIFIMIGGVYLWKF